MNKIFLNKVVDQIISEISFDCNKKVGRFPSLYPLHPSYYYTLDFHSQFLPSFPLSISDRYILTSFVNSPFVNHCKDVYSLNDDEISYVWCGVWRVGGEVYRGKMNVC
jgi:hypothetical protein